MKISVIVLFIISILMAIDSLTVMAQSSPEEQRARKIVEKIDELFRSNSSYSEMEMNIVTTHWQRSLKMKIWTSGKDKTFIRILEPLKERGMRN